MAEDIRVLVERLTTRVGILEGPENFTARFKAQFAQQFAKDSSLPEGFKKAVQGEIAAWKEQQDAAQKKLLDPKWHADNMPVTGAKAEGTGLKADVFVGQFEYGLFKHEYSLTQFWAERKQQKRDQNIDGQLAELKRIDGTLRASIKTVRDRIGSKAKEVCEAARKGDQKLHEQLVALRKDLRTAERTAGRADQRSTKARTVAQEADRLSKSVRSKANRTEDKAKKALEQVTEVRKQVRTRTNEVERNTKAALRKVDSLRNQVEKGMQRVRALESGAKSTGQAVKGLRSDLEALDKTLRR